MSKLSNESHVVSAAKSRVLLASFVTVLSLYLLLFIYYYYYYYYYYASVNSSCTQLPPPGLLRGIVSPRGGAFANFALSGGRAFVNPGAIPELLTFTRLLSEYNYTDGQE